MGNGLEVLDTLKRQHYDLIFMDVQMPEMDGFEATKAIIKQYHNKRPLIIAMTANALDGDKDACIESGMDDYINKPFKLQDIELCILS